MKVRLQLGEPWVQRLCRLPETGMGYQLVDVELKDGLVVTNVFVFNAEELEWPADNNSIRPADILSIRLSSQPQTQD